MKLAASRVQDCKRINDTGRVACRDLSVLIGKSVAAASTSAGGEIGPREQAKRDARLPFMRAVNADADSMPALAPPILAT